MSIITKYESLKSKKNEFSCLVTGNPICGVGLGSNYDSNLFIKDQNSSTFSRTVSLVYRFNWDQSSLRFLPEEANALKILK